MHCIKAGCKKLPSSASFIPLTNVLSHTSNAPYLVTNSTNSLIKPELYDAIFFKVSLSVLNPPSETSLANLVGI